MSKFIPNAYQTPNWYLDNYMSKLTSDEWKVLSYAIRRIIGFNKESDRISLSQFSEGNGRDYGTGLSKPTCRKVLDKLVEYNLLIKIEDYKSKTNTAVLWRLQLDSDKVNDDLINSECQKRKNNSKKRTVNARQKIKDGCETPLNSLYNGIEQACSMGLNHNKQLDKQNNIKDISEPDDSQLNVENEPKKHKPNPVYETYVKIKELEPSIVKGYSLKVIKQLFEKNYTHQQIINCVVGLQKRQYWIENNIKITPTQIKKHIDDFIDDGINYLEDGTMVISEIKHDSNVGIVESRNIPKVISER